MSKGKRRSTTCLSIQMDPQLLMDLRDHIEKQAKENDWPIVPSASAYVVRLIEKDIYGAAKQRHQKLLSKGGA